MPRPRRLIVGTETRDDAAVFRLDARRALVATVDFFAPVVDDPRDYGAIAAANALSDVYAMGGKPLYALNLVGFPRGQPWELLTEILAGGAEKAHEAGCPTRWRRRTGSCLPTRRPTEACSRPSRLAPLPDSCAG